MDQDHTDPTATRRWPAALALLALLLVGGALTTSLLSACLRRGPEDAPAAGGGAAAYAVGPMPADLFRDWPAGRKPDVVLVLSGQQHSYLKFCGCSSPQLGGFERRYNFMQLLRDRGWPLVAADLGDLVEYKGGELHGQALLKYEIAMSALEKLGYTAIALGADDYNLPLREGLSLFTLQKPDAFPRILAANLTQQVRMNNFPLDAQRSMIGDWQAAGGK